MSLINAAWVCKYLSPTMPDAACIIQTCLPTHYRERVAFVPSTHHLAPTSVYQATCVLIKTWSAAG